MLSNRVTRTGMSLPTSTDLYFTLRSINRVGLSVERTSAKFQIDTSPPVVVKSPTFITKNHGVSLVNGTQFDNSLITLQWQFQDLQSSIVRHQLVLEVNRNGHVAYETKEFGSQMQITLMSQNGTFLKDGDAYIAKVTSCNGARLCTTAISDTLLIDSTPPSLGGFMNTMTWINVGNETRVQLLWYGFIDHESGIHEYLISVSSSYSGNELSDGLKRVRHANYSRQTVSLTLSNKLNSNDVVVLTVIAINSVGLRSSIGKVSVILVPSDVNHTKGILTFQRHSCISHYCNNDCTCAVVGKKCLNKIKTPCKELQNVSELMLNISVNFGLASLPSSVMSSDTCFSGFWTDEDRSEKVLRYEWSIGESGESPGFGIFDRTRESLWYDNGLQKDIVYCLPAPKKLSHGQHYTLYIKAWVSENEFSIFHSKPLLVDLTPPERRRGHSVIESEGQCLEDVDYIDSFKPIKVCWENLFSEKEGEIVTYYFSGGTIPFGRYIGYHLLILY